MGFRVDEKGKVFTDRVTKYQVSVIARVLDLIIEGNVHLKPENRLKDELNDSEQFIAITHAQAMLKEGEPPLYTTDALIVNKAHIAWIFPRESNQPNRE